MAGDKKPVDPESNRSSGEKAERSERSNLGTVRKDAFLTVVVDMATSVGRGRDAGRGGDLLLFFIFVVPAGPFSGRDLFVFCRRRRGQGTDS